MAGQTSQMKTFFTTLILLLTLLLELQVQAQAPAKARKFFVGLSLGPSLPTGKFSNKNYQDTTAGLAQAGPSLSISAGYMFTRSVGLMLMLGAQENKQDTGSITSYLKQQYGDTIGTSVTTHNWKIARILAGGIFELPLPGSEKLFFQAKILAGVLKTTFPGYVYRYGIIIPNFNNPNNYSISASYGDIPLNWAFCYQANAGLGWKLTRRISLIGDVSYFHAEAVHKYDHYLHFSASNPPVDTGPWERKYGISSLNLMAGAEIKF